MHRSGSAQVHFPAVLPIDPPDRARPVASIENACSVAMASAPIAVRMSARTCAAASGCAAPAAPDSIASTKTHPLMSAICLHRQKARTTAAAAHARFIGTDRSAWDRSSG